MYVCVWFCIFIWICVCVFLFLCVCVCVTRLRAKMQVLSRLLYGNNELPSGQISVRPNKTTTNCMNYNIYYTRTSSIVKKSILFYDTSSLFGAASIRYVCMYIHILLSDFIEYFGNGLKIIYFAHAR